MKQNANLVLPGSKVILIPYRPEHVPIYHAWMQDSNLQDSTASDPLTLEEEYEMQKAWHEDKDKCTFILLDPDLPETEETRGRGGGMAGDVNFFLNDPDNKHSAEVEVMLAEPRSRGKGMAFEAVVMFILFGVTHLDLRKFVAKIGFKNSASQRLFHKLGFKEESSSSIFQEVTLVLEISESTKDWLLTQLPGAMAPHEPYDA